MTLPIYPASDLEQRSEVRGLAGSFWSQDYEGHKLVEDILFARAQLELQTFQDLEELFALESWETIPLWHQQRTHFLTLLESELNSKPLALYDDGQHTYGDGLAYDVPPQRQTSIFPAPDDLHDVQIITNRITRPSLVWVRGVDFDLRDDGLIEFRLNPFDSDLVAKRTLLADNEPVDRECGLWLFRPRFDRHYLYQHYGYLLLHELPSSEAYRDLIAGILNAQRDGAQRQHLERVLSGVADTPLAGGDETVERVEEDAVGLVVVTDAAVYRFPASAAPLVEVGDTVAAGDPLVDTLQIFEFNRGQTPAAADLPQLAIGDGLLGPGYQADLVFRNETVETEITTDDDGLTRLEFDVVGQEDDVTRFWDTVQARGVEQGGTLAQLLDSRTAPTTQPASITLPATINPMQFLLENCFRHHLFVVKLKPSQFGPHAAGCGRLQLARRIVPPHTMMLVYIILGATEEGVTMEGPGDESRPGAAEEGAFTLCMPDSEDSVSEHVRETGYFRIDAAACA